MRISRNGERVLAAGGMIAEPYTREYYSTPELPFGSPEEGWRLTRAFARIKDPAVRKAVLDMVSELAARDALGAPALGDDP